MWDGHNKSDASKQSFDSDAWNNSASNADARRGNRPRQKPPHPQRSSARSRRSSLRTFQASSIDPVLALRPNRIDSEPKPRREAAKDRRQKSRPNKTSPAQPLRFPTERRIDRSRRTQISAPRELKPSDSIQFTERPRPSSNHARMAPSHDRDAARSQSNKKFARGSEPNSRRRLEIVPTQPRKLRSPAPHGHFNRVEPPAPKPKLPRSARALVYGTRLLILGVGIGVLAGTLLSVWDPASRFTAGASQSEKEQPVPTETQPALPQLQLSQEISPLKSQIQAAVSGQTQFTPGLMIVDTDTQSYLEINGTSAFPAASTIKFPILVAFFQDVDAGKIRLDEMLTLRKELIATESGDLQYQPIGSQFSAIDVATRMITVSDNTATNMIIDRLGGKDVLNQRFQSWGLSNTALQNPLPDLNGTNTSSPRDMVTLLNLVNSGRIMSLRSHERMLDIMRRVVNNSLLPQGLGQGATIAHKTGDIGTLLGDVGMVDLPNGKRYLIAALVKRPFNDYRAGDLIRQMSQLTYQYFNQTTSTATPTPNQSPTPAPSPSAATQDAPRPAAQ